MRSFLLDRLPAVCFLLVVLFFLPSDSSATRLWRFQWDLEGWTPGFPPDRGTLVHHATMGNPPGCAQVYSTCSDCGGMPIVAPLPYPLSLSGAQSISYDVYLDSSASSHERLRIYGTDGTRYVFTPPGPITTMTWITEVAPLVESSWVREAGSGSFNFVLANVSEISLDLAVSSAAWVLLGFVDNFTIADYVTGACCIDQGYCGVMTYSECVNTYGGTYLGDDVSCHPHYCWPTGCCTYPAGGCEMKPPVDCLNERGWPVYNSDCSAPVCVLTACCVGADGTACMLLVLPECDMRHGQLLWGMDSCDPNPCLPSACCDPVSGSCEVGPFNWCMAGNGVFLLGVSSCEPYPCNPSACCDPQTGACSILPPGECEAQGGIFLGLIGSCMPDPCPRGACCDNATGTCRILRGGDCYRELLDFQPEMESCSPNPCVPIPCCFRMSRDCGMMLWRDCQAAGGAFDLEIRECGFGNPCDPSPFTSTVDNWDAWGAAFVSPGAQSQVDLVTIVVRNAMGVTMPGIHVWIDLGGCASEPICMDSPEAGLSGVTDMNGVVRLNPRLGGCGGYCPVVVRAEGVELRTFNLKSTDWNGFLADGRIGAQDVSWFASVMGTDEWCADYDGNGNVGPADYLMLMTAFNAGDANSNPLCATVGVENPPSSGEGTFDLRVVENPVVDQLRVLFSLPRDGTARIEVFDAAGRLVTEILNGPIGAGPHSVEWRSGDGDPGLAPGVYFVRMTGTGGVKTVKFILLR
jgi:hypothetical protein